MRLAPILRYAAGTNIVICGAASDSRSVLEGQTWGMAASYSRGRSFLLDRIADEFSLLGNLRAQEGGRVVTTSR